MTHNQKHIKKGIQNRNLKEEAKINTLVKKINLKRQDQVCQVFLRAKGITNAMTLNLNLQMIKLSV